MVEREGSEWWRVRMEVISYEGKWESDQLLFLYIH